MMESGKGKEEKGMEYKHGQMGLGIKEIGRIIKLQEEESLYM